MTPAVVEFLRAQDAGNKFRLQRGEQFPVMEKTLQVLSKIYRVLEMRTFQGLAQEAVETCIASLKQAEQVLRRDGGAAGERSARRRSFESARGRANRDEQQQA